VDGHRGTSSRIGAQDASSANPLLSILPKGIPPAVIGAIERETHKILTSHGIAAFLMSRDAAIVHEVGHTIVAAAEGQIMQSVRIFSRSTPVGTAWGGWCDCDDEDWTSGPDSSVESDLSRARIIIGGLVGEAITGMAKPGSSLDEQVMSQVLAHNAAVKLADHSSDAACDDFAEQLWREKVFDVTIAILRANEGPFEQLAGLLDRKGKVKGHKLRAVLDQVRGIS
jgi:hypothetical protein